MTCAVSEDLDQNTEVCKMKTNGSVCMFGRRNSGRERDKREREREREREEVIGDRCGEVIDGDMC